MTVGWIGRGCGVLELEEEEEEEDRMGLDRRVRGPEDD